MAIVVGLAVAGAAQAGEASCLLRITFDTRNLPLNYDAVNALVDSRGGGRGAALEIAAIRDAMDDTEMSFDGLCGIGFQPVYQSQKPDEGMLLGRLTIHVEPSVRGAQDIADRILKETCRRLERDLAQTGEGDLHRLKARLAAAEGELDRAMQHLRALREEYQEMCAKAGMHDLELDLVRDQIQNLTHDRREAEMALLAREAHRAALVEEIAKLAERVEQDADKDPVAEEMENVVKIRQMQLMRIQELVEAGTANEQETWVAQEQLAMARAELAERRLNVAEGAGAEMLRALNQDLSRQSMITAEARSRIQFIEAELEKIQENRVLELAQRYETELKFQMDVAEIQARDAAMSKRELEKHMRGFRPAELTILGGIEDK
jgi:hypothetical protein